MTRCIATPPTPDEQAELTALVEQVNEAVPKTRASIESMISTLDATHLRVDAFLREVSVPK